jgi:hypothetical protein
MSTRDPLMPEERDPLIPDEAPDAIILEEEGSYVDSELPVDAVVPNEDDRLDDDALDDDDDGFDDDLGVTRDAADEGYRHG